MGAAVAPPPDRPAVLLVDDVPANILALQAILKRDDVEILTATSGPQALEILLKREVALAIVDVEMPEMDGFELAELMRGVERTSYVPIIFLTAGARDLSRVFKGYESGAVDFLFKPVDNEILRSKVGVFVTLEKQRQQLRQAERMREMFVGILGHDLRNPLNGIMASAQGVKSSSDAEARNAAERILGNGIRMARMIEQLLDVTRFRLAGGISLSPRPADLRALVEQVLTEFEFEHARERIRLETAGNSAGTWDADRILQIVSNLVGNAVRHSPPGTPIRIRVEEEGEDALGLLVHNGGAPIPAELRGVLFDAFRSGTGASQDKQGLGLGLYITRQLVLAHGGTISFESDAKSGTSFRVSIPRHVVATTSENSRGDTEPERAVAVSAHAAKTILFVEDEPTSRLALGDLLKRLGYRVLSASTPSEALKAVEKHAAPVDLLLSDVRLPEMRGEELAAKLRTTLPDLKVIFMSGLPGAHPDASAFVLKPIEFETLAEVIERVLS